MSNDLWRQLVCDYTNFCKKHQITNMEFVDYWNRIIRHESVFDARREFESILKVFEPTTMVS